MRYFKSNFDLLKMSYLDFDFHGKYDDILGQETTKDVVVEHNVKTKFINKPLTAETQKANAIGGRAKRLMDIAITAPALFVLSPLLFGVRFASPVMAQVYTAKNVAA